MDDHEGRFAKDTGPDLYMAARLIDAPTGRFEYERPPPGENRLVITLPSAADRVGPAPPTAFPADTR